MHLEKWTMIALVVTICIAMAGPPGEVCQVQTLSTSDMDPSLNIMSCMRAEPKIAQWMQETHPQWRLKNWKCKTGLAATERAA